ncbi:type I inositol polyphosphate 5-phosphatase 8-like [Arachis duranensis]|uniref:Type I inositol polyphosphate 5-phosphatase 8-like n=1 Tax=Arachis duranensis TaxID=130453 RepID=A0A9C6TAS0_ARADU|nr:type I inositol polyphosphate 5-phosphatase 8-like [Arachis duranensis]
MQVLVGQMYYSGYGVPRDDQKGSVSVSMSLFHSCLCFVCSHLTSGQKDGAEQRQNADVNMKFRDAHASRLSLIQINPRQSHLMRLIPSLPKASSRLQ